MNQVGSGLPGREAAVLLGRVARQAKRRDPVGSRAFLLLRDGILDAAARGDVDLDQPVAFAHDAHDDEITVFNPVPRGTSGP